LRVERDFTFNSRGNPVGDVNIGTSSVTFNSARWLSTCGVEDVTIVNDEVAPVGANWVDSEDLSIVVQYTFDGQQYEHQIGAVGDGNDTLIYH
jgi:hypothetical protein